MKLFVRLLVNIPPPIELSNNLTHIILHNMIFVIDDGESMLRHNKKSMSLSESSHTLYPPATTHTSAQGQRKKHVG